MAHKSPRNIAVLLAASVFLASCGSSPVLNAFRPTQVSYNDTRWCVPWSLKRVINRVSRRFGSVTIHSTHRWPLENWRKGGASRSYHMTCRAVDFKVGGNPSEVLAYLRSQSSVGGYKHYGGGVYHIDTGPRRTW